mgnify:CR=1 FL=1
MPTRFPSRILPYVLLAPSILIVAVFLIIPSIQSLYLSFFQTSPFGNRMIFVGFRNFSRILRSPEYLNAFWVTFIAALVVVGVGLTVSLLFAVLANQRVRGSHIYRTLMIWPYALSPAVAGTIWALLWHPSAGWLPYVIQALGGPSLNWMTSGNLALLVVSLAATWKMLGYNVIFFLAGLQGVPRELEEAAAVDGASSLRRFIHITLPFISPTAFFLLIMNSLYAFFEIFGLVDVMTKGGPGRATDVLVYKLWRDGFVNLQTGLASAESIILFVVVAILTVLQFRFAGQRVFYQ